VAPICFLGGLHKLLDTRKEFGGEANAEKIKYTFMSHHQNAGKKSLYKEKANITFTNVAKFKYLGIIVTN
jgi:hypothetical protein